MTDLMKDFASLEDEYYPGSRQRRRESQQVRRQRMTAERIQAKEDEPWDAHPRGAAHPRTGEPLELFPVGALAKAVGRQSVTIRSWIRKGWLPKAMYQTKPVAGSRGDAGRRLWTRKQIEGIVKIAREEGLLDANPPRMEHTHFTEKIKAAWKDWA
jgi:hypothetical protein